MYEKAIFIIPGFGQKPTNKAYKRIASILEGEGYSPILVDISWEKATLSENTVHFLHEFKKVEAKKKYILGFSYGAMVAFVASTYIQLDGLVLCSLSPYFSEDLPKIGKNWTPTTLARYQDFAGLYCSTLAKQIKANKVMMLYGEDEAASLIRRVKDAFEKIDLNNKYLVPVEGAEHDIGNSRYLLRIHQVAQRLV